MENMLETLQFYARSGQYKRVPVSRELFADAFTPVEVMRTLRAASRHCYLLESAEDKQRWGRYSFLGYSPTMEITCTNGHVTVTEGGEEEEKRRREFDMEHPGEILRKILQDFKSPAIEGMPPFTGGLVGYFSYDYMKYAEPSLKPVLEREKVGGGEFRDMDLMLFDKVIVFDNYRQKLLLITGVSLEGNLEENYRNALSELSEMERLLKSGAKADFRPLELEEPQPEADEQTFCAMVERAKEYIREGDIFQVVLSDPMTAPHPLGIWKILRTGCCAQRTHRPICSISPAMISRWQGRLPRHWHGWRTGGSIHFLLPGPAREVPGRKRICGWKENC